MCTLFGSFLPSACLLHPLPFLRVLIQAQFSTSTHSLGVNPPFIYHLSGNNSQTFFLSVYPSPRVQNNILTYLLVNPVGCSNYWMEFPFLIFIPHSNLFFLIFQMSTNDTNISLVGNWKSVLSPQPPLSAIWISAIWTSELLYLLKIHTFFSTPVATFLISANIFVHLDYYYSLWNNLCLCF
jgi:hypothetical protein